LSHKHSTKTTRRPIPTPGNRPHKRICSARATQHKRPDNTHPQACVSSKLLYKSFETPSNHNPTAHQEPQPTKEPQPTRSEESRAERLRCSRPLFNNQTPHPPTPPPRPTGQGFSEGGPRKPRSRVIPQNPNSVSRPPTRTNRPGSTPTPRRCRPSTGLGSTEAGHPSGQPFIDDSTSEHHQAATRHSLAVGVCAP
jgi:hypothetical protein